MRHLLGICRGAATRDCSPWPVLLLSLGQRDGARLCSPRQIALLRQRLVDGGEQRSARGTL